MDGCERAEEARGVFALCRLGGVVRIGVGRAHEARRRSRVARYALHAASDTPCAQLLRAPCGRLRVFVARVQIVVEIGDMPRQLGRIGQHVGAVFVDVQPGRGAFHHDTARAVGNNPVQQRFGLPLLHERYDPHVGQRTLRFVGRGEVTRYPQGEFEGGNVAHAFGGFVRERSAAREVEARHGEACFVGAVEIHRLAVHDAADAEHGVGLFGVRRPQRVVVGEAARRGEDFFAVGFHPIEVAPEEQGFVAVGESDGGAHGGLLVDGTDTPRLCHVRSATGASPTEPLPCRFLEAATAPGPSTCRWLRRISKQECVRL